MQSPRNTIHTFLAATVTEAIPAALAYLLLPGGDERYDSPITLVYSGEGLTPSEALASALEDIQATCADHPCRPAGLIVDGVMRTDTGTRIWGTVNCEPGPVDWSLDADPAKIGLETKGEGEWALTLRSHTS